MENRFENDKQVIVVLSFFINSQKQENRLRYCMGCHYRQNSAIVTFVNGASNFVYGAFVFINGASVFVNGASNFVYGAFVFTYVASKLVYGAFGFTYVASKLVNGASYFVKLVPLSFVYGVSVVLKNAAAVFVNGASNIQQSGNDSLVT